MTRAWKLATIAALGAFGPMAGLTEASAGGGCHSGVTEGYGTRIEMVDACFTPTTLFAEPGETITFVNRDSFAHNITANGWGQFDELQQGDRYTMSSKVDGVFAYACSLHPGMSGAIVFGEGDSGSGGTAVGGTDPVAASTVPTPDGDGSIAAGAFGFLLGIGAGVGIAIVRRRASSA